MEQEVLAWITQYGYLAIFFLLVFGIIGLPIPDETMLTFSGYLVYKGHLSLPLALLTALAGSITGITISYWLGRSFGLMLIHRYGRYVRIREEHIQKTHAWFERVGHWGLTFGYFIPGVRHFTAYVAGMAEVRPHQFAAFAYTGAFLWVSTFLAIGYFLGERWEAVQKDIHHYLAAGAILCGVAVVAYLVWRKWKQAKAK